MRNALQQVQVLHRGSIPLDTILPTSYLGGVFENDCQKGRVQMECPLNSWGLPRNMAKIRTSGGDSISFESRSGVRQICTLSPTLFINVIDLFISRVHILSLTILFFGHCVKNHCSTNTSHRRNDVGSIKQQQRTAPQVTHLGWNARVHFPSRMKPWMLPGPRHRGLTTKRALLT